MTKFSYEERLEAVLRVVRDGMGCKTSAKIGGISRSVVQRWVALYREFGPEGLSLKNGTYDGKFKIDVIEYMHKNHLSLFQASTKFGVPNVGTVAKWERIYYEEGPEALLRENRGRPNKMSSKNENIKKPLDPKVEEDLIEEVQRLRMENEYLKKLHALVQERIDQENGKKPEQ